MSDETDQPGCEEFVELLSVYDELSAAGLTPSLSFDGTVPVAVQERVRRSAGCVDRLRRAFAPPTRSDELGEVRIGRFQIIRELGRGAHGVVFLVRDTQLRRDVALKVPRPEALVSPELRERFLHEARAAAALDHPNIVAVYEVGQAGAVCYLATALVPGVPLTAWLAAQRESFDPRAAAELFATLAAAVHHAHTRGVVHRDLKPANILLGEDGVPKITDFGLAKLLGAGGADGPATRTGAILGTPEYMAPEQAQGKANAVGPAADTYSLGAMFYEAIAGQPPFRAGNLSDLLEMVRSRDPVPPGRLRARVPRALDVICLKCLRKDPADRYPSAQALADDLGRFLAGRPILARPVGPAARAWTWVRRNPSAAGFVAAVSLLTAVLAIGLPLGLLVRAERDEARASRDRAERAEREVRRQEDEALARGHLAQARALRQSGRPGRRFESLVALGRAAGFRPSPELRDEVIACLALADIRPAKSCGMWPPENPVAAFDPAFERYARGSGLTGRIDVRTVGDGRELFHLQGPGTHPIVLRFSRDGRFLASIHADHCAVRVWDLTRKEATVALPASRAGIDFSPDGRRVAVSRFPLGLGVYDAATGRLLKDLPSGPGAGLIAFDPAGRVLAVCTAAGVELRDADSGRLVRLLTHPEGRGIRGVAWRPDGRLLAVSCGLEVFVWDPLSSRLVQTLRGHEAEACDLAFHPSGAVLASGGWDATFRFWDPVSGAQLFSQPGTISEPQFSRDGRLFGATVVNQEMTLWEVADGRECRALHSHAEVGKGMGQAAFSPDGRLLATGHDDGTRLWDATGGREAAFLPTGTLTGLRWPTATRLVTRGAWLEDWPVRHDAAGAVVGPPRRILALGPGGGNPDIAVSPDGRTVAVAERAARQILLPSADAGDATPRRTLPGHDNVNQIALSPDGRWVAGATHFEHPWDVVRVSDTRTEQVVWISAPHKARTVAFSPDGRWMATGGDVVCRLWEVGSWRLARELRSADGSASVATTFSPDGSTLAVANSSGSIRLIDVESGDTFATLPVPGGRQATWLAFSRDAGRLAAYSSHVTHVWDLRAARGRLAEMGLDWDSPPYPPPGDDSSPALRVIVDPGPSAAPRE